MTTMKKRHTAAVLREFLKTVIGVYPVHSTLQLHNMDDGQVERRVAHLVEFDPHVKRIYEDTFDRLNDITAEVSGHPVEDREVQNVLRRIRAAMDAPEDGSDREGPGDILRKYVRAVRKAQDYIMYLEDMVSHLPGQAEGEAKTLESDYEIALLDLERTRL